MQLARRQIALKHFYRLGAGGHHLYFMFHRFIGQPPIERHARRAVVTRTPEIEHNRRVRSGVIHTWQSLCAVAHRDGGLGLGRSSPLPPTDDSNCNNGACRQHGDVHDHVHCDPANAHLLTPPPKCGAPSQDGAPQTWRHPDRRRTLLLAETCLPRSVAADLHRLTATEVR
jgi:hypothetical protein